MAHPVSYEIVCVNTGAAGPVGYPGKTGAQGATGLIPMGLFEIILNLCY